MGDLDYKAQQFKSQFWEMYNKIYEMGVFHTYVGVRGWANYTVFILLP